MGSHSVNVEGTLVKTRLNKEGKVISNFVEPKASTQSESGHDGHHHNIVQPDYNQVKKELTDGEGCRLLGNISVLRVPGNFHISSHAYAQVIGRLAQEGAFNFDLSHTINHISFGEETDIQNIKRIFNDGILSPLDNTFKQNAPTRRIYEYYLKVVPTTYIALDGQAYQAHQFTANSNEVEASMMIPAVFFRFDLSPILVKYIQVKERIFHFFIEICAIIGGIYTVTSVILSMIINSVTLFLKNKEK